jgi:pyridoxal phosphate enzyme (YggS family)
VSGEVTQRLAAIRARVEEACARAGRPQGDVALLAVSKRVGEEPIRSAYAAGQRDFGENYAQELRDKATALAELPGLRWHAIGSLQTNKARYVAQVAHSFQALDRVELARELSRRRPDGAPALRCFLEVNLAAEPTKSGVSPAQAAALLGQVQALPRLEVVGLMALPPQEEDPEALRPHFRRLRALGEELGLPELSMGTTLDFEVAIEEGATVVRVGTAIFGPRPLRSPGA